jgi:hypothetical protein
LRFADIMSGTEGLVEVMTRNRPPLWTILAAASAAYFLGRRVWSWYRLRHIKGPPLATVTDFWLIRKTWRGETFAELGKLCQEYGMSNLRISVVLQL